MTIKDAVWCVLKPAARLLLPHWHAAPLALTTQEALARVQAVFSSAPLFPTPLAPLAAEQLDVSVIVPVYNGAAFLEQCIGSLATQRTQRRFEIIAVDDGSTDHSAQLLHKLAQKYTRLRIVTQENCGIGAARNAGIAHATGRYLSFVDNDDFVASGFIDTLCNEAELHAADFVKCGYRVYDCDTAAYTGQVFDADTVIRGEMGDAAAFYNGFVWGCLFHRSLFSDIRFPADFWYEDMITRMLLMRKCRCFVNVRAALYTHTEHAKNASKTVWTNGSAKSLDQYYLPIALAAYGQRIGLGTENGLYAILLEEFGTQLRTRTAALPLALREAVFVLACACLEPYRTQATQTFTPKQLVLDDALARRDMTKWRLGCLL